MSDVITNTRDGIQDPPDPRRLGLIRGSASLFPCIACSFTSIARSCSRAATNGLGLGFTLMDAFILLDHSVLRHFTLVPANDTIELRFLDHVFFTGTLVSREK
ncbi:unnamed protein product [Cuscuta campestris]|uniref:Uncharacterized protein n=1 Tax=Cuscuta campestris TaxID=132261 RepID=A0A484LJ29_9ASTE|nr:unnamed protein product [Cuscuta campestris]